jgi:hypothetical protein
MLGSAGFASAVREQAICFLKIYIDGGVINAVDFHTINILFAFLTYF